MRQHRILLINPKRHFRYNWDLQEMCSIMGKKNVSTALALPLLAAITPSSFSVQIIDEEIERLPATLDADLIGISALVSNIRRAYEIADMARTAGIPVVMGGPQVTFEVETALQHADSVVLGEAEDIWARLLDDFTNNSLQPTYKADNWIPFRTSPIPRWDLLPTKKLMSFNVQVSRGCPFKCSFCLVRSIFGEKQRYRDIDDVIREIESLPPKSTVTFADDNLTANKSYAKELMKRLIPLSISWNCQASLDVAYDTELLSLMARSGCTNILIGFETLDPENLKKANKNQNDVKRYEEAIRNIHTAGIHILASFVVGFDSDTLDTFDRIFRFVQENNISFVMLNALSAYPGSDFYTEMEKEGRLMGVEPDFFNGMYPTMKYTNISQEEMYLHIQSTLEKIYSTETLTKRGCELLGNGSFRDPRNIKVSLLMIIRSLLHVLKKYRFSSCKEDRVFFSKMMHLFLSGKTHVTVVFEYLLLVSSIQEFLDHNRSQTGVILQSIRSRC